MTSKLLDNPQLQEIKNELEDLKYQNQKTKHYVKFYSAEVENPGFEVSFNLAKDEDRVEVVRSHLLGYQPHYLTQFARWADITFHFDDSMNKDEALNLVKTTKQRLMEMASAFFPEQIEFFNRLFIFEYYKVYDESAVVVRIRNKADTQQYIDHSLFDLTEILKLVGSDRKSVV